MGCVACAHEKRLQECVAGVHRACMVIRCFVVGLHNAAHTKEKLSLADPTSGNRVTLHTEQSVA